MGLGSSKLGARAAFFAAGVVLCLLVAPAGAAAAGRSGNVAALQVALRAVHVYRGGIDGLAGPRTRAGVRRFQRRHRLVADGRVGPRTRRALGRRGRPAYGSRVLRRGMRGWDVAALQFFLARRGVGPGGVDGGFGGSTAAAVRRFQRGAGLGVDGVAGPATLRAVRRRGAARRRVASRGPRLRRLSGIGGPVLFFRPVNGPIGDGFGMRWGRPHQGIDFPVAAGTPVGAAGRGVAASAGFNAFGYGNLVIVQHREHFQTWYAHLSTITVSPGASVTGGTRIGTVGSTGHSTGPHLHFEVRHHGVPIDPMPRLLGRAASARDRSCVLPELRRRGFDGGAPGTPSAC